MVNGYILGQNYFLPQQHQYRPSMLFEQLLSYIQSVKRRAEISLFNIFKKQQTANVLLALEG